jgi:hypothetical protein
MCSVTLALFGTGKAGHRARLYHGADDAKVRLRLAQQSAASLVANDRAIEVEPNTAHERRQVVFAEACVRARGAAGRAVDALANTSQHR